MLKIENTEVLGWKHAIRGMRNPMNSWEKSDSEFDREPRNYFDEDDMPCTDLRRFVLGSNDLALMTRLRNAGTDHRKFMRMITVYVDITGPLYWWKEFDTYKVGTVANSCSTMHKIAAKKFTLEDFSHEHLIDYDSYFCNEVDGPVLECAPNVNCGGLQHMNLTINLLNYYRQKYLETKDKKYWWQMIQLLPSSYNQRRTVMLNYEVLANIYKSRRNHKLDEWHTFCDWIEGLPYSELITTPMPQKSDSEIERYQTILDGIKELGDGKYTVTACELCNVHGCGDGDEENCKKCQFYRYSKYAKIEHLVDITCSWDIEELGGDRIYAIGPGFTREDLTPYELYLMEKSESIKRG